MRLEKTDKTFAYTWLAVFYMTGAGLSTNELCSIAGQALGESFSPKVLEETIEELREKISLEDREEWVKLIRKFLSNMRRVTKKG